MNTMIATHHTGHRLTPLTKLSIKFACNATICQMKTIQSHEVLLQRTAK